MVVARPPRARTAHSGEKRAGDAEQLQQLVVPLEAVDVEEEGTRRVRYVADVHAGEVPREPGVDRARSELAALCTCACAGYMVEQPRDLRGGEVRLERQAGTGANELLGAGGGELSAALGGTSVLPDDCRRHGAPVDRSHSTIVSRWFVIPNPATRSGSTVVEHRGQHRGDGLQDLLGVVLDEAGLGMMLLVWHVRLGDALSRLVDERGAGSGRALVERENQVWVDRLSGLNGCSRSAD